MLVHTETFCDIKYTRAHTAGARRVYLQTFQELPDAALVLHAHHHGAGGDGSQVAASILVQTCLASVWTQQLQVLQLQIQSPRFLVPAWEPARV